MREASTRRVSHDFPGRVFRVLASIAAELTQARDPVSRLTAKTYVTFLRTAPSYRRDHRCVRGSVQASHRQPVEAFHGY